MNEAPSRTARGWFDPRVRPVILLLAERDDPAARWLHAALQPHLDVPVRLVSPMQLVCARSEHRLSTTGGGFRFTLAEGTVLDREAVRGVINRMTAAPTAHLGGADVADRAYAATELHAFLLGWLASLDCPLLNPASPESLSGPWHSTVSAMHFAATAGLACAVERISADAPPAESRGSGDAVHVVFDDRVIGPVLPAATRDAMIGFARLWGARLVQIETAADEGARRFVAASSLVDYPRGGAALVGALARALAA